jgi:hypothetical protein
MADKWGWMSIRRFRYFDLELSPITNHQPANHLSPITNHLSPFPALSALSAFPALITPLDNAG